MGRYERELEQGQEEPTDLDPRPDEVAVKEELEDALRAALEELDPDDLGVLRDRYYEGRTFAQIGRATGRSAQAVWNQLHGALCRVREVLLRKGFPPEP